jgi:hypothetical protein
MNNITSYPQSLLGPKVLLSLAVRHQWQAIIKTWKIFIVLALCYAFPLFFHIDNVIIRRSISAIIFLIAFYINFFLLLVCDRVLSHQECNMKELFSIYKKKMLPLFVMLLALLVPLVLLYLAIVHYSYTSGDHEITTLILSGLLMMVYVNSLMAFPLMLLRGMPIFKSFITGAKLCNHKVYRVMVLYVYFVFIIIIVLPISKHAVWLHAHFLSVPFNFVILCLLTPIVLNFWLLIFNDLTLRMPSLLKE